MISAHQEYLISFVVCISMKEWSRYWFRQKYRRCCEIAWYIETRNRGQISEYTVVVLKNLWSLPSGVWPHTRRVNRKTESGYDQIEKSWRTQRRLQDNLPKHIVTIWS